MKSPHSLLLLALLGSITSCQSNRTEYGDEIVCETVHRYGVPLEPKDWLSRGQHGQVVSMRKDGVAVTRSYEAGILHGECTYTFPHRDVIQTKEIYQQGNLRQIDTYYPSGFPQKRIVFQLPNCQIVTTWYENGAPHAYEKYEDKNLVCGQYYNIDQKMESRVEEGNGLRNCRNGQGQLQSIDTFQNGQIILSTTYHSNGLPASITPYINGNITGERRTYSTEGDPQTIETWSNNTQHGITQVFEYGEKRADVPYVNGQKHGIERLYRNNGQVIAQEITWLRGEKHGPTYSYLGDIAKTDWYFCNRLVPNKETFDMLSNK